MAYAEAGCGPNKNQTEKTRKENVEKYMAFMTRWSSNRGRYHIRGQIEYKT